MEMELLAFFLVVRSIGFAQGLPTAINVLGDLKL